MAIITVSRQLGTESQAIAQRTAAFLGYSILDRAIVTEVAHAADIPKEEVERHDERGQNLIERLLISAFGRPSSAYSLGAMGGEFGVLMAPPSLMNEVEQSRIPNREDILSMIEEIIKAAARRDNVVIVGRGSQALLAEWPGALHVRLVAPMALRVRRIAANEGVSPEKATVLVQETDRNRERYIRQHYGVDWEDPDLYHLIVNTGLTGIETAARVIAEAAMWMPGGTNQARLDAIVSDSAAVRTRSA